MILADWVMVDGPIGDSPCQTVMMACSMGGDVPVLSYLFTQLGADITLTGKGELHMFLYIHNGLMNVNLIGIR